MISFIVNEKLALQKQQNAFEGFLFNEHRLANSMLMNASQVDLVEAVEWQNTINLLSSMNLIVAKNGIAYQDKK